MSTGFWSAWIILVAVHVAYLVKLLAQKLRPVTRAERCRTCKQAKWDCECELDEEPW